MLVGRLGPLGAKNDKSDFLRKGISLEGLGYIDVLALGALTLDTLHHHITTRGHPIIPRAPTGPPG